MLDREQMFRAFQAILDERRYQEAEGKATSQELGSFVLYMERYLVEAASMVLVDDPLNALDALRKVAALAVAAMEIHGVVPRLPLPDTLATRFEEVLDEEDT